LELRRNASLGRRSSDHILSDCTSTRSAPGSLLWLQHRVSSLGTNLFSEPARSKAIAPVNAIFNVSSLLASLLGSLAWAYVLSDMLTAIVALANGCSVVLVSHRTAKNVRD
jgi:hypothetical protein